MDEKQLDKLFKALKKKVKTEEKALALANENEDSHECCRSEGILEGLGEAMRLIEVISNGN